MRSLKVLVFGLLAVGLSAGSSSAGVYTDELTKCTIEATTVEDRAELVKWMFAAASAHPAVKPLASVSARQLDEANKAMANLLTRILIEDCGESARKAFKYEGPAALQTSMQALGQIAGRELFADPAVATALSGLEKHSHSAELKALMEGK